MNGRLRTYGGLDKHAQKPGLADPDGLGYSLERDVLVRVQVRFDLEFARHSYLPVGYVRNPLAKTWRQQLGRLFAWRYRSTLPKYEDKPEPPKPHPMRRKTDKWPRP